MLLLLAGCLLLAPAAPAQDPGGSQAERSRRALALSGELMSPFCPGRTLADCPSAEAGVWREEIRTWINAGVPEAEIRRRLQARMPESDLSGLPRGPLGWVLPVGIVLGGLGLLLLALRRVTEPRDDVDPELEAQLLAELDAPAPGTPPGDA